MNDIENTAGLFLAGIVVFIFLMVIAFIKRNNLAKTDEPNTKDVDQSKK